MALSNAETEFLVRPHHGAESTLFSHHQAALHRGVDCSIDNSSFAFFNPDFEVGAMAFAASLAVQESIGSQVACRLALEHFTGGALDFFRPNPAESSRPTAVEALESAFKRSNQSVYSFSHGLAAGGRLVASLVGMVLCRNFLAVARVGSHFAYLVRGGEVFSLFEDPEISKIEQSPGAGVGIQSRVEVEVASLNIQSGDTFVILPQQLQVAQQSLLAEVIEDIEPFCFGGAASEVAGFLTSAPRELAYFFLNRVGPKSLFLRD